MRPILLRYSAAMLTVTAIAALAVLWCHLSHLKTFQGPRLFGLWSTHGVHLFDLVVLAAELLLLALLSGILLAGFTRPMGPHDLQSSEPRDG